MKNIIPKLTEYDKDNGYISNINITLRKLHATEKDYLKLYSWCQNKFVYEWFEQRILSYDEIVKKYQNKLRKKIQDLYIIKLNQKDIGLVQIYKFENDITLAELDKYRNIYEYDLFIGEKEYLNKGIGPKVVNFVNKLIYKKYNADLIILRPFKRNIRAIKCYQKCGFREILEYEGRDTLGNKEIITVLINKLNRWSFGTDNEKLVRLVLEGKKTATTSLYDIDSMPQINDISVLTDSYDNSICIVKTKKVIVEEFKNITWNIAKLEGENSSLDDWKKAHRKYFKQIYAKFKEDTKVIFEIFEVVKKF